MNYSNRKILFSAIFLGLIAWASPAIAQQYKVDVGKPDFDNLLSPEVGGNTGTKKFRAKEWLEVEVKFKLESSNSKEKFVDRVTVKWYVAAKVNEGGSTKARVIEKEVS